MRLGINGLGRTGRMVLSRAMENSARQIELVAANDLTSIDELAYLIKYDSVHGKAGFKLNKEAIH